MSLRIRKSLQPLRCLRIFDANRNGNQKSQLITKASNRCNRESLSMNQSCYSLFPNLVYFPEFAHCSVPRRYCQGCLQFLWKICTGEVNLPNVASKDCVSECGVPVGNRKLRDNRDRRSYIAFIHQFDRPIFLSSFMGRTKRGMITKTQLFYKKYW